jgi:3-phenylpropionate/trans-cinnamate dioxygenase ferredoxin subunit
MPWRPTGLSADSVAPGQPRSVEVDGAEIVLVRIGAEVFAVADHCPHRDGQLSDGTLDAYRLTCPLHGAVFDLRTGAVCADPFGIEPPEGGVEPLARYATKLEGGSVWVELP